MSTLMILVGPNADTDPYLMDLASVAAGLAIESGRRVLFAGTAQSTLAVGTALVGSQQERTVEGGERSPSPMVLFGLVRSIIDTPDSLYKDPEFNGDTQYQEGGLLSDLIDLGIMDLAEGMEGRIIPKSIEDLTSQLNYLLEQEEPSQILVIGRVPEEMLERPSYHAKKAGMSLGIIGGDYVPQGAEKLFSEVGELRLDGVLIRGVEQSEQKRFRVETTPDPLIEAVKNAVWEAGLSHVVTVWVQGKRKNRKLL